MIKSPHIHLIQFYDFFILFDVNKNEIKRIDKGLFDELGEIISDNREIECYLKTSKNEETKKEILNLLENGFLKNKRPRIIEHPEHNFYEYYLEKKMRKLILQVTQDCNFRCSYCDYTCGDNDFHRKHQKVDMPIETALKAIEFFKKHSLDQDWINVSFYGGEPLLNFSLIKKCIEVIQKEFAGKYISFNLTTNGLLLNSSIAIYLIDNNVNITVSLDGPKDVHDRNRKLAKNGEGTFNLVYRNLKKLYSDYPDYYSKISYNCVVDPRLWNETCNEFFKSELFKRNRIIFSPMHPVNGRNIYYPKSFLIGKKKAELKAAQTMIKGSVSEDIDLESRYWLEQQLSLNSHLTEQNELPDVCGHSGPCVPGVNRLFVNTSGDIFPCEKANENSRIMKLGNVYTGIDMINAKKMLNVSKIIPEKCQNCWGILHCNICACTIDAGDFYSAQINHRMCNQVLQQLEKNIIRKVLVEKFYEAYRKKEQ